MLDGSIRDVRKRTLVDDNRCEEEGTAINQKKKRVKVPTKRYEEEGIGTYQMV